MIIPLLKICDFLDLIHDEEAFLEILSFIHVIITGVSPIVRESLTNNPNLVRKLLEIYNKPIENHHSAVCEAQFQSLEALSLCFSQLEKNNSGFLKEKAGFLGLLWQRTMDFA